VFGETVIAGQDDQEALLHEVATLELLGLAPWGGSVLEGKGQMQVAGFNAGIGLLGDHLLDRDRDVVVARAEPLDGSWDQVGERGRERADSQLRAGACDSFGHLHPGELKAGGDGVGMLEQ
jgi:hypothetical protein